MGEILKITAMLSAVVIGFLLMTQPGGSGVLASLRLADGSEYLVTQYCNWDVGEPYTVAFYMRSPGEKWGWCHLDHEAFRWRNVDLSYDGGTDVITITERGDWQASLDRRRKLFVQPSLGPNRQWTTYEVAAPQGFRDPEFLQHP